jgi:hypothetical protein
MAQQRDFLLELYRQTSQDLRDSDRNRNFFFEVYAAITVGALSLIARSAIDEKSTSLLVGGLIFLTFFGIGTTFYVAIARKWHCLDSWAIESIRNCLKAGTYELQKAGESVKEKNIRDKIHFFNPAGTEFIVFLLVLLLIEADISFIIYLLIQTCVYSWIIVSALIIFATGIVGYWKYLDGCERKFPKNAWSLLEPKKENNGNKSAKT